MVVWFGFGLVVVGGLVMLDELFGVCGGQVEGLDELDLEAMRVGGAIRAFREFRLERACSRDRMRRKVRRGAEGARERGGLSLVPRG